MKEATGELFATVVVIIAVGVLTAFFYYTIWPIFKNNFDSRTQCSKAICDGCAGGQATCEYVTCHLKDSSETFECVFKG